MKKRDLIINILPFLLMMAIFVIELLGVGQGYVMTWVIIVLIAILPLIVSVYNTVASENCSDIVTRNAGMAFAWVLGILFSSAFTDSFVQRDPEMEPVMALGIGLAIVYVCVLTLICCVVKRIVKKK